MNRTSPYWNLLDVQAHVSMSYNSRITSTLLEPVWCHLRQHEVISSAPRSLREAGWSWQHIAGALLWDAQRRDPSDLWRQSIHSLKHENLLVFKYKLASLESADAIFIHACLIFLASYLSIILHPIAQVNTLCGDRPFCLSVCHIATPSSLFVMTQGRAQWAVILLVPILC